MFKHELGVTVKDTVTGYEGIVMGRSEYLTGCNQYAIQPVSDKKNDMSKSFWIDEQRLQVVKGKKRVVLDNGEANGCDIDPPSMSRR